MGAQIEKETEVATHQTGRNSGVVHSGLYYKPGSLKAVLCRRGVERLREFCAEKGLEYRQIGKVVVGQPQPERHKPFYPDKARRKFYHHRAGATELVQANTQTRTVYPLPPGVSFRFRVDFANEADAAAATVDELKRQHPEIFAHWTTREGFL